MYNMEILKIKDWIKIKTSYQFDFIGDTKWIIRLADGCPFHLNEVVLTVGGRAHIISFESDCIHVVVQHAPESIYSSVAGIYKFQVNDIVKDHVPVTREAIKAARKKERGF